MGVLALGAFANYSFPSQTAVPSTMTASGVTIPQSIPSVVPLAGAISARNVSCALATGVCALTVVNKSSMPLQLENCQVQVITGLNMATATYTTTGQSFTTHTTSATASNSTRSTNTNSSSTATGISAPTISTVTATETATTVSQLMAP